MRPQITRKRRIRRPESSRRPAESYGKLKLYSAYEGYRARVFARLGCPSLRDFQAGYRAGALDGIQEFAASLARTIRGMSTDSPRNGRGKGAR